MTARLPSLAPAAAALLVACATSHVDDTDAAVPIDVDLTEELAPRCPSVPTPAFEVRSEGVLSIPTGDGAPSVWALAAEAYGERTDVLLRYDDVQTRFVLARFEAGRVSTVELEAVDASIATVGDVRAAERSTRVTWDVCHDPVGAGHCPELETHRATVPLDGPPTPIEITARLASGGYRQARLRDLGDETVVHGLPSGFFVDRIARPDDSITLPTDAVGTLGEAVDLLGAGRWLGWTRDDLDARLFVFADLDLEAQLSIPALASSDVVLGDPWIVYLERNEDDLARSRLRVSHRRPDDLSRVEPDRWLDGWGGFQATARVVALDGAPWVFFFAQDARYDTVVLHASRLDGLPCGRSVEAAVSTVVELDSGWLWSGPVHGAGDHVLMFARRAGALELTSLRIAR